MLNKKAIAAFAAGATLLSGLAVAAPALAENAKDTKAPAATAEAPKKDVAAEKAALEAKKTAAENAKKEADKEVTKAEKAFAAKERKAADLQDKVDAAQEALDTATPLVKAYVDAKNAQTAAEKAETAAVKAVYKAAGKQENDYKEKTFSNYTDAMAVEGTTDDQKAAVVTAKETLNAKHGATYTATANAAAAAKKADNKDNTTELETTLQGTKQDLADFKASKDYTDAKQAVTDAKAKSDVQQILIDTYTAQLAALDASKKEDPKKEDPKKEDPKKEDPKKEDPKKTDPKKEDPKKEEEGKVVLPKKAEELKAYMAQVQAYLKSEKDAKKLDAAKAAYAEFGKAAKALKANKGDKAAKAAFAAALKKLAALVPYTAAKPAPKPEPKPTESTDLLFTPYPGMSADLAARGVTNVAAYDALLDKLEFGYKQTGWGNILKNFGGDNCASLGVLRRQLQKAVLHYGHVEAAVKDIVAELTEDYNDAKASENWDAAKVIKEKLAKASGLLKVSDNNRTRAAALLDSANDHARDLSCDTGAKEVLDAMKREPNFPGKPAPAPAPKTPKAPKLPNTGAVVALAAVAASVLAGMGAALRKIRH